MPVRAQVVYPQVAGPRCLTGWFAVEEQDVGLDPLGVEYAGRETQKCMNVALVQQVAPYGLPRASLEQNQLSGTTMAARP